MITKEMIEKVIEKITKENQKECIHIYPEKSVNLSIFDSKFGGIPYLPKNFEVPYGTSDDNGQLALLAQINCTDLPENNLYPKTGILQFWIGRDDLMGLDGDYKVVYFENIDNSVTTEEVLSKYEPLDPNDDDQYSPLSPTDAEFSLTFEKGISTITATDFTFEKTVIDAIHELYPTEKITNIYDDLDYELTDYLYESLKGLTHAIGGYPNFTQWDPRDEQDKPSYTTMLLQIETEWKEENNIEIMWGDCGVGNFFISEENLKNLYFEDVLYNWDCG